VSGPQPTHLEGTPALTRIRAMLPSLKPSDARVARTILDDPEGMIYRSVSEVAELARTSTATVVRCAQRLGFRGFHQLKVTLAREHSMFQRPADSTEGVDNPLLAVTAAGAEAVRDAGALVSPDAFAQAVDALSEASRVLFVGVGTSSPLVQDAAYRFRVIGLVTDAPADVHMQHVSALMLGEGEVCVAISHSGATRETNEAVNAARASGATTILITSFLHSPLADLADIVLTAGTREVSFRLEAMASRLAHLAVVDALLVAVADRDPVRSQRALDCYADTIAEHRA
jgi:DNA-binding MurR/RpiR family transcriptional regulator